MPQLVRPFFLHRRELLGELCRAAWESVAELIAEASGDAVRPGMVAARALLSRLESAAPSGRV